jgi:hypothetical protein
MRREPMQVIPTSNSSLGRLAQQHSAVSTADRNKNNNIEYGDGNGKSPKSDGHDGCVVGQCVERRISGPPPLPTTHCHDDVTGVVVNNDCTGGTAATTCSDIAATSAAVDVNAKPVIPDVKLIPRDSNAYRLRSSHYHRPHCVEQQPPQPLQQHQQQQLRSCRSSESIDRLNLFADLTTHMLGSATDHQHRQPATSSAASSCRSSFVDPNGAGAGSSASSAGGGGGSSSAGRRSCCVYIDLGDYQTLLKHGQDDAVYSLPQPQCYGDETLRAVRLITEKYDTFKRRQLRALSFRDATVRSVGGRHQQQDDGTGGGGAGSFVSDATAITEEQTSTSVAATANISSASNSDVTSADVTKSTPDLIVQPTDFSSATSSAASAAATSSTLSRTIITLSRYGLESGLSASSVDDFTILSEVAAASSSSEGNGNAPEDDDRGMSKTDRLRIELFYRSRETEVYVCSCLADLFVGASGAESSDDPSRWIHLHTGVPVWLLNTGRAVRRRELVLVLADRRTGLPLWRDRISYLSNYGPASGSATAALEETRQNDDDVGGSAAAAVPPVHFLRLSSSLSKVVRLAMFSRRPADAFLARFRQFTADPNDDLWKISDLQTSATKTKSGTKASSSSTTKLLQLHRQRRTTTSGRRLRRNLAASKASISLPCVVVLVTRVDPRHPNFRAAFAHLLPPPPPAAPAAMGADVVASPVAATTDVAPMTSLSAPDDGPAVSSERVGDCEFSAAAAHQVAPLERPLAVGELLTC